MFPRVKEASGAQLRLTQRATPVLMLRRSLLMLGPCLLMLGGVCAGCVAGVCAGCVALMAGARIWAAWADASGSQHGAGMRGGLEVG